MLSEEADSGYWVGEYGEWTEPIGDELLGDE
jgi:hypothetical protein